MISWIQNAFQKHFRVIFVFLLAIVIVSFVFTIGAAPGIGQAGNELSRRTFFGLNLGSPEDSERLFGDASLSVFLQAGYSALNDAQLQDYALQRQAGLHLADNLNLPGPTPDEMSAFVREKRAFAGPTGEFDPQAYSRFRDSLKTNPRFNEAALARVLADDYRYERVQELLGGPGYVMDADVTQQLVRADTTWQINVATVDYASFTPDLQPTEAELKSYFESNAFRYEMPAKVRVAYVDFPAAAFVDQVNVTPDEVRAYYDANPARFPNPAKAATPAGTTPAVSAENSTEADFEAVRAQVEAALRLERARRLAAQAASDLTVALFEARATPATMDSLLASRGQALKPAEPFARQNPPAFLGGNPQHAAAAFALSEERPVSDALATPQGAVVLVWQETIPAHPALFATVQEQVRKDHIENERRQRFVALGRTLRDRIAARTAQGESFEAAVAAEAQAQNVKAEAKSYGPFARREPPQDVPFSAINAIERLAAGQVSDMVVTADQGLIVHVANKTVPDIGPGHERFDEVRTQMASFNASRNASDILTDLVQAELERTAPTTR